MPNTRRELIGGALALAAGTALPRRGRADPRPILNDASRLDPTPVAKHWRADSVKTGDFIARLRAEIAEAKKAKRPVAVGVARHSMGGQSLPRGGTAITLRGGRLRADIGAKTYQVDAGARWADVIQALDPLGFSPSVMQSNNDFGVGSTFCVNSHGWAVPYGPFGSTVRAMRLMLADGTILECSRDKNSELFRLAMGGYGLFGIIIDLDIDMVPNMLLAPRIELMTGAHLAGRFIEAIAGDATIRMAYGRLSVARDGFLDDAELVTFRPAPDPPAHLPAPTRTGFLAALTRDIYRAQTGNEIAKRARWLAETRIAPAISSWIMTRNTVLNTPVSNLASDDRRRTDILHEYFLPPERLAEFLVQCRTIIPAARAELLNVTLRYVDRDDTAVLAYAPTRRVGAVMAFSQQISPEAEVDMRRVTERLIDAAVGLGGAFYLPYRLHARRDQVHGAYPRAEHFAQRKRFYDPDLLFRNAMWDAYFA